MSSSTGSEGAEGTFIERARRDQIVTATVHVLAVEGYRKASISRIAEEAGISKGLVLYHFAGKDDLMRQTLLRTYEWMSAPVVADLDKSAPPPDVLRTMVTSTVSHGTRCRTERRAVEQIVINQGIAATEAEATISFADKEPLYRGYEELFRAGQHSGYFRDFDVRVMAVTYQGAVDAMFKYLDSHPEADAEAYGDQLADLLLAAVNG